MPQPTDLLQGTLDLLILRTLALEPMHGWGISKRIQRSSQNVFQIRAVQISGLVDPAALILLDKKVPLPPQAK
jgi:hypothetical protein